jgi:hypothetical protein
MPKLESNQMNLQEHKVVLLIGTAVLALVVASPALQRLLVLPQTEFFTEFWILGPEGKAENYPFNITHGTSYNVFLGLGNQLGRAAYYEIQVKFRNQTQPAADSFNRTSSTLPPLYGINVFVADKETWELRLTFSFEYTYDENLTQVNFSSLTLNGNALDLRGNSASWDSERSGFFGNMFFELWIYNDTTGSFNYHERFTGLRLNMTVAA